MYLSKLLTPLVTLMLVPIIFRMIGDFCHRNGTYDVGRCNRYSSKAIMMLFAILYFGSMIDSGLFKPLISQILKVVKGDPLKIVLGTAVLYMMVALDGDGPQLI